MFGRNLVRCVQNPHANGNGHCNGSNGNCNGNGNVPRDESFYGRGSPVTQKLRSRFGIRFGNYRGCYEIMEIILQEDPNNLFRTVNSPPFKIAEREFLRLLEEAEHAQVVGADVYREQYASLCKTIEAYRPSQRRVLNGWIN